MTNALTQIKSVNKTDVFTLLTNFGSFKGIVNASIEELAMCPGLGERKCRRIWEAFREPFMVRHGIRGSHPQRNSNERVSTNIKSRDSGSSSNNSNIYNNGGSSSSSSGHSSSSKVQSNLFAIKGGGVSKSTLTKR